MHSACLYFDGVTGLVAAGWYPPPLLKDVPNLLKGVLQ